MPRKPKPLLEFIQDTREQKPWSWDAVMRADKFEFGGTIREALGEGDYSVRLDGELLPIRIERKELGDMYACCGNERARFVRELERLTAYDYCAVIIEAPTDHVARGFERSRIPGNVMMASIGCWSVKFGIHFWFGDGRQPRARAAGICRRLLEEFAVHYLERGAVDGVRLESGNSDGSSQALPGDTSTVAT